MKSEKYFSRSVMKSMILFMGISFIVVSIGVYFYRSYCLKKDYYDILDTSQKGFSDTLTEQLSYIGEGLNHILADNIIKGYLINNETNLLHEMLKDKYAIEAQRIIVIYDNRNRQFFPELPRGLTAFRPLLEKLSLEEKQVSAFQKANDNLFVTVFSMPIMDEDARLGTGYLLYDMSKDRHFT
ncbi:MAG: hypothetical protein JW944_04615 [Deltaproteobacteria bacterium]|nr:hypothetical protein [Deltaproteobacteria bacterium]